MATQDLTEENFVETVTKNDLVIVDFRASWCGRALRPVGRRPVCGSSAARAASDDRDWS